MASDYAEYEFFLTSGGSEFQMVEQANMRSDLNTYMRSGRYTCLKIMKSKSALN